MLGDSRKEHEGRRRQSMQRVPLRMPSCMTACHILLLVIGVIFTANTFIIPKYHQLGEREPLGSAELSSLERSAPDGFNRPFEASFLKTHQWLFGWVMGAHVIYVTYFCMTLLKAGAIFFEFKCFLSEDTSCHALQCLAETTLTRRLVTYHRGSSSWVNNVEVNCNTNLRHLSQISPGRLRFVRAFHLFFLSLVFHFMNSAWILKFFAPFTVTLAHTCTISGQPDSKVLDGSCFLAGVEASKIEFGFGTTTWNAMSPPSTQKRKSRVNKIIHQMYKNETLPALWVDTPGIWQKLHPGFEYMFWTDESLRELIETHYSWFLPQYDAYKYNIQRSDASRYFVLYHYGGIYADMDVLPKQSLVPFLDDSPDAEAVLVQTPNMGLTNQIMMASKESEVFRGLLTHLHLKAGMNPYTPPFVFVKALDILGSTGPSFLTGFFFGYKVNFPHLASNVVILDAAVLDKRSICSSIRRNLGSGLFKHLKGDSWLKESWYKAIYRVQRQTFWCNMLLVLYGVKWLKTKISQKPPNKVLQHKDQTRPISHGSFFFFLFTSGAYQLLTRLSVNS